MPTSLIKGTSVGIFSGPRARPSTGPSCDVIITSYRWRADAAAVPTRRRNRREEAKRPCAYCDHARFCPHVAPQSKHRQQVCSGQMPKRMKHARAPHIISRPEGSATFRLRNHLNGMGLTINRGLYRGSNRKHTFWPPPTSRNPPNVKDPREKKRKAEHDVRSTKAKISMRTSKKGTSKKGMALD